MPNNCSAPGCRSNYDPTDRIPVFKMPEKPDKLKHAWFRALHRDDIDELKVVYVCSGTVLGGASGAFAPDILDLTKPIT